MACPSEKTPTTAHGSINPEGLLSEVFLFQLLDLMSKFGATQQCHQTEHVHHDERILEHGLAPNYRPRLEMNTVIPRLKQNYIKYSPETWVCAKFSRNPKKAVHADNERAAER